MMTKILIVVVRYRTLLETSATMRTLAACFAQDASLSQSFAVFVWDNSPESQPVPAFPFALEYHHSPKNLGVSGAYNHALELAEQRGYEWLLLLDQDTTLPAGFLSAMRDHAARQAPDAKVAAIAPSVFMNNIAVSPKIMSRWGGSVDPAPNFHGLVRREMIMMNSGLLLRVAALRAIGGYSMDFWLDFSDRYVCHRLAQQGFSAWVAGDVRLEHEVSLMAGASATSAARFATHMGAQDAYFSQYKSFLRNIVFCQRLLRNAWSDRNTYPDRSRLMWWHLKRRLTMSRQRRLREWRQALAAQRGESADTC